MLEDLTELPANLADPITLVGATLYLMTRYQEAPCGQLAFAVTCHLELLSTTAAAEPKLRDLCDNLADRWTVLSRNALPASTSCTELLPVAH